MRLKTLLAATVCLLSIFAARASAQARAPVDPRDTQSPGARPARSDSSSADEDFDLNIDLRRISERDFSAGTAVSTDATRGLLLNVGVVLRASDIEATLRNVRGHVRFRASLGPVLRLLGARREAPAPQMPAPTPP